jgi:2-haloacid dehalogenase
MLGIETDTQQLEHVVNAFSELEPQPSALEAFRILTTAGWKLVALTNGSEDSTRKLLERANALEYFASIFSCDAVQKTKPHPDVYAFALQDAAGDVWMVAVHACLGHCRCCLRWKSELLSSLRKRRITLVFTRNQR